MKYESILAAAIVLLGISRSYVLQAADMSLLLNKADALNYEDTQIANTAKDKGRQ